MMRSLINFLLICFLCGRIRGFKSTDKRLHQKTKIGVTAMMEHPPTKSKKKKRNVSKINDCNISASLADVKEEDMMITDDECFEPLQIPCEINGYVIPAIIDTGAQVTVMSEACAKRCRINNLVDARYSGQAVGMGSSDILGRINGLSMRVGPVSYQNQVCILRESRVDLILGLDFLRRFNCEINLEEKLLKLKVRGRTIRLPFISNYSGPLLNLDLSRNKFDTSNDDVLLHDEEKRNLNNERNYQSINRDDKLISKNENHENQFSKGYSDIRNKIKSNYQEIDDYKTDVKNVNKDKSKQQSLQDYCDMKNYMKKNQKEKQSILPTAIINDYDNYDNDDENCGDDLKGLVSVSMEGV